MGVVKVETLSQNRGVHELECISLNDEIVVQYLLEHRCQIDDSYQMKLYEEDDKLASNGTPTFHELVCAIYLDIDRLIKKGCMTQEQYRICNLMMRGYNNADIIEELAIDKKALFHNKQSIVRHIILANKLEWYDVYAPDIPRKVCGRCGRWLPIDSTFFSPNKSSKDGYHSICRGCR